jgi:hypothetical protein
MSYPPLSRLNTKVPSLLLTVPLVVFNANTEAPGSGSFVSASIILPLTENWENESKADKTEKKRRTGFFIEY